MLLIYVKLLEKLQQLQLQNCNKIIILLKTVLNNWQINLIILN